MKILLCNERFLFRFGVDRVLMILGKYFKDMGHQVVMIGNKLDEAAVEKCTDDFIKIPEAPEYINSNEYTLQWLKDNWDRHFDKDTVPDIALIAGWPFYESIKFLKDKCGIAIFHDYGAVPVDNMEGPALITQQKLRKLRNENLSYADEIVAISNFLEETQSKMDSKGIIPTSTILLGCDHMELGLWTNKNVGLKKSHLIEEIESLINEKYKIVFLLGRFEAGNYKNSEVSFSILRGIKKENSKIKMLILAKKGEIEIPKDLEDNIKLLGFVSDEDLQNIMKISDVGISVSLWEGFNLPLAEMQLLKKPVFVFNKGAHPEVVANQYYLCNSEEDMIKKVNLSLSEMQENDKEAGKYNYKRFKEFFTWRRCAIEFAEKFISMQYKNKIVLMDVTNACHDTANSGVMRVTRHIAKNIQDRVETLFILWDNSINKYVFPYNEEIKLLSSYGGPKPELVKYKTKEGKNRLTLDEVIGEFKNKNLTMLITETINEEEGKKIRQYCRSKDVKISAIFYDAIPVLYPEFCNEEVLKNHKIYMKGLAECDVVIPISESSGYDLIDFWKGNNIKPTKVTFDLLSGELEGIERAKEIKDPKDDKIKLLCISTLEPRKNHKRLLNACMMISKTYPNLDWELNLVGNRYAGNDDIPNFVEKISKENSRIKWLGVVDDETLIKLYKECTFTIYPSLIEGYGMPIIESLWNGKVCLCSNSGVMSELARDGGCYTVNIKDEKEIMEAIYTLSTNFEFRRELEIEAVSRHIRTWQDYTLTLLDILYNVSKKRIVVNKKVNPWKDILFRDENFSCSNVNSGEKLALISMLEGLKPECAISIGDGKYLDLISHYSDMVFSVSYNNELKCTCNNSEGITFFSGPCDQILKVLISEIEKSEINIDFIFIDMNDNIEHIHEIINVFSNYKIQKTMFIVIYNSFMTEVRDEISKIKWSNLEHLKWIDFDFQKGFIEINENNIVMVGGFAVACLSPKKRIKDLEINQMKPEVFKLLKSFVNSQGGE